MRINETESVAGLDTAVLASMVANNHMWLLKFKIIKFNVKFHSSVALAIFLSAQEPQGTGGYISGGAESLTGQHCFRSSQMTPSFGVGWGAEHMGFESNRTGFKSWLCLLTFRPSFSSSVKWE